MSDQIVLGQIENQIIKLPTEQQIKLLEWISQRLGYPSPVATSARHADQKITGQYDQETTDLLALMDAAADMWQGDFDAAEDIRQMRQGRDAQIKLSIATYD